MYEEAQDPKAAVSSLPPPPTLRILKRRQCSIEVQTPSAT